MSELEAIKELARDAISALNYIEGSYGKLYGVGWERLYESAKSLLSEEPKPTGAGVSGRKVHLDKEINDTYWEAYHASRIRENKVCHYAALRAVLDKHCPATKELQQFHLSPGVTISGPGLKEIRILPKPTPIAERLPEAADCDSKGMCWLTTTETEPGWVLDNPEQCTGWTHWLPFQSLPLAK